MSMQNPSSEIDLAAAATLRKALRRFYSNSARVLREHGLTNERYELLLAVRAATEVGRGGTSGELATELELAQSSLTQLARRALDAGLLRREVSSRDGRVHYLALTDQGEAMLNSAAEQLAPEGHRLLELMGSLRASNERPAERPS
jgi:DNA-binding MarR family transcriptional regulator